VHSVCILGKARFILHVFFLSGFFFETFIIMPALAGSPVRDDRIPGSSLDLFRRARIPGRLLGYIPAEEILQCTTWPEVGRFPQHCQSCQLNVQFAANELQGSVLTCNPGTSMARFPGFSLLSRCSRTATNPQPWWVACCFSASSGLLNAPGVISYSLASYL